MQERQPRAVVGGVDDIGVIGEFQVINRLEQTTHLGVDVFDGVNVGFLRIGITHVVRHIQRDVRHGVRDVHKERLILVGLDEVDGLLCAAACDGALVDRQLDDFLILKQRRLPLGERGLWVGPEDVHPLPTTARFALVVRVIHVVGIRNTKVGIESIGRRQRFLVMPKVPFSETSGGIALTLQVISDGVLLSIQPLGRGREQHVLMHAHSLGITTRQQRRTRRRAHRRGHHEARELPSLLRNAIDVWCLDRLRTETAQVAVPLIIGEDDHKVRLGGGHRFNGEKKNGQQTGQGNTIVFHEVKCGTASMKTFALTFNGEIKGGPENPPAPRSGRSLPCRWNRPRKVCPHVRGRKDSSIVCPWRGRENAEALIFRGGGATCD